MYKLFVLSGVFDAVCVEKLQIRWELLELHP